MGPCWVKIDHNWLYHLNTVWISWILKIWIVYMNCTGFCSLGPENAYKSYCIHIKSYSWPPDYDMAISNFSELVDNNHLKLLSTKVKTWWFTRIQAAGHLPKFSSRERRWRWWTNTGTLCSKSTKTKNMDWSRSTNIFRKSHRRKFF